ncbi:MAG: PepSY-like domain-containing protein [Muribaculaceae bacterium]|nr:PepSY-like domain-containing protein [Muribaculaceae bacterium]
MKKNYLKLLLVSLFLVGGLSLTSCSDKDDEELEQTITISQLPSQAQTFLNQYFADVKAKSIEKQYITTIVMYKVELVNDFEIMFNSEGVWQEVDAPDNKTIPTGIAPSAIEEYVNSNYPDYGINEINKTGEGYNVELISGLEMAFNELGEFLRVISDF